MSTIHNQGIIFNGGTVTAHQIVAGSEARAECIVQASQRAANAATIEDLRVQLNDLLKLMQENRHCLAPDTEKAMEVVRQEAAKPEPSKLVIGTILDSVSAAVKSLAPIAGAVTAVAQLVKVVL
jgi:hypothetical protein